MNNCGKEKKENRQKHAWFGVFCLFVFLLLTFGFGTGIFLFHEGGFFRRNQTILSIVLAVLVVGIFVVGFVAYKREKKQVLRATISISFMCAFVTAIYFVLIKSGFLAIVKDSQAYRKFLESAGGWMAAIYILLQFLQVIILPIPTIVSTLAGVALFGPALTILYSFIGAYTASLTAFFLGRRFGAKAISWVVGKETLTKWRKRIKGKDNLILTAMFLLPLFPDDILCFVAGFSSMSNLYFILMIGVCRLIGIAATCYSAKLLPLNTWWGCLSWGVLCLLLVVGFTIFYKNIDKINAWIKKKKKKRRVY